MRVLIDRDEALVEAAKEMREAILYSPDFDGDTINHVLALWDSIMPVPIDAALAAYEAPDPIEAEYQRAAVALAERVASCLDLGGAAVEDFRTIQAARAAKREGEGGK